MYSMLGDIHMTLFCQLLVTLYYYSGYSLSNDDLKAYISGIHFTFFIKVPLSVTILLISEHHCI